MPLFFRRGFTLQEALEIAYNDDLDVEAIYIEPPDVNVLTDEESGDEDAEGDLNHLPPRQLLAGAEILLRNNSIIDQLDEPCATASAVKTFQDDNPCSKPKPVTKDKVQHEWIQGSFQNVETNFPKSDFSKYGTLSPVQLFELFFTNDLFDFLLLESTKYASFKNNPDPKITIQELRCAIAILILSGYNEKPGKRYYWDSQPDMGNPLVINSMRRNRFFEILKNLHCADNTQPDPEDKGWKIRPLMDKLKATFLEHFVPEQDISYDESMVKYYGKHSCKQFIRGKPIRFGFKMWCLNSKDGYLINFDLYQGKNPRANTTDEILYGKCSAPLKMMIREMPENIRKLPFKIYFDNLFTSVHLLKDLKNEGYWCTGTMRENFVPKGIPLPVKKTLQKSSIRGEHHSVIDRTTGIIFARWADNNIVTVASTCHGVEPVSQVRRYSQKERKIISVPRPNLIGKYNAAMGGTDLMDENIGRYRIAIRSKKWWWTLFTWLIDVSIHNAWFLWKKSGKTVTQLQFRREIVNTYLTKYGTPPKGAGRPSSSLTSSQGHRISDDIRYDRTDHLLVYIPDQKRRRCAMELCNTSARTMCQKCNIGLCLTCNVRFHTK